MKWISVQDELPSQIGDYTSGDVLITDGEDCYVTDYFFGAFSEKLDGWNICLNCPFDESSITHWMPLPEPPTNN